MAAQTTTFRCTCSTSRTVRQATKGLKASLALPLLRHAYATSHSNGRGRCQVLQVSARTMAMPDLKERLERFEWDQMKLADMSGKTVLVTGGNSGIGFAACLALAKVGAKVVMTARDEKKGREAEQMINDSLGTNIVQMLALDLGDFSKVRSFVKEFREKHDKLHVLINNAGIHLPGGEAPEKSGQRTPEGYEVTLGTNYFGPMLLTEMLLDMLKDSAPSRIVMLGSPGEQFSGGVYWDDLKGEQKTKSDMQVYGTSKLYNIMAAKALNERLKGSGIEVFSAHPGITSTPLYDKTDKTKPLGAMVSTANAIAGQPAERGAMPILYAAASPEVEGKGGAFIGGPVGPLTPFSNLDQFKDRTTFTEEGKHLEDCLRLYDLTKKLLEPELNK